MFQKEWWLDRKRLSFWRTYFASRWFCNLIEHKCLLTVNCTLFIATKDPLDNLNKFYLETRTLESQETIINKQDNSNFS